VRKPLVIFTPKSLLRHHKAVSTVDELINGEFREVITEDPAIETPAIETKVLSRVILCSGKVYYDLLAAREDRKAKHIAIVRIEQLYPFPETQVRDALSRFPPSSEVLWVQEEPRNMGAWRFMAEQVQPLLDGSHRTLRYVGRPESASPAAGSLKRHNEEQAAIVSEAISKT
jgi:2-oxoglutarate dehydrogenase E1 component